MRQYIPVITLAMLVAFALAVVSGGLLPSDNAVLAEHIEAPTNTAPLFTESGPTRNVSENSPAGVNIGAPIAATDADGDVLTYTLGETDADSFDIDAATGQLLTKSALDYEDSDNRTYTVTVTADDGTETDNSSATDTVVIMVTNVDEQPAAPAAPVVTTGSTQDAETTTLEINWYAPASTGPAITDYDYRYKKTTETTWTTVADTHDHEHELRRFRRSKPTRPTRCRCARRAATRVIVPGRSRPPAPRTRRATPRRSSRQRDRCSLRC